MNTSVKKKNKKKKEEELEEVKRIMKEKQEKERKIKKEIESKKKFTQLAKPKDKWKTGRIMLRLKKLFKYDKIDRDFLR